MTDLDKTTALDDAIEAAAEREERLPFWDRTRKVVSKGRAYVEDLWSDYGFEDDDPHTQAIALGKGARSAQRNPAYYKTVEASLTGYRRRAGALVTAHGMVKSLVGTFADEQGYEVRFDEGAAASAGNAGGTTDLTARRVTISPAPVLDPTIDAPTAGRVMTAMAVHEAGAHVRHGRDHSRAVARAYPGNGQAATLDNILTDARGDAAFVAEYPGYADVYAPAIEYVATTALRTMGADRFRPGNAVHAAGLALRYDEWTEWAGMEAERDWWQAWASRASVKDSVTRHLELIQEGINHIADAPPPPPPPAQPKPEPDEDESDEDEQDGSGKGQADDDQGEDESEQDGSGEGEDGEGDESESDGGTGDAEGDEDAEGEGASGEDGEGEAGLGDQDGDGQGGQGQGSGDDAGQGDPTTDQNGTAGEAPPTKYGTPGSSLLGCMTEAVDQAAKDNGAEAASRIDAQDIIDAAANLDTEGEGIGEVVRANRLPERYRSSIPSSGPATAIIRAAFMRSRSGHTSMDRGMRRGRCDSQSLHRIAMNDTRLFHRRNAPSPGKYLVWLLVDQSSSMSGGPTRDVVAMAKALAEASAFMPSMRMAVYGWTNSNGVTGERSPANWGSYLAWQTGEDPKGLDDILRIRQAGTPDRQVLDWGGRAIRKAAERDEQPVVLMLSDGQGGISTAQVEDIRRKGVEVISVAVGAIDQTQQEMVYGHGGFIPWMGDLVGTARPLANLLARMLAR